MPKVKETRVSSKGEKPRKAPKPSETKRKVPSKSEEIVVESDSDDSGSSGHSSGSELDPKKRKNTKKPNEKKIVESEPTNPPVPDDTSEEDDDSSSEEESDEETEGVQDSDKTPKVNGKSKNSQSKDVDMNDASSEVSEGSEDEAQPATQDPLTSKPTGPPSPFQPPSGFSVIDVKGNSASALKSLLPNDSSSSKQIWHITAPAGLSISELSSIALAKLDSNQAIMSHKGTEYSLAEDKHASDESGANKHVFVPTGNAKSYAAVKAPVSRTLHIQQVVNLPNLSKRQADPTKGSNAAADANQQPVRGPRPQPKGLRMRFKPPGFGAGRPGAIGSESEDEDDDVEMTDAAGPPSFQTPKSLSKPDSTKRKQDQVHDVTSKTPKSDKKRKKDKESTKDAPAAVNGHAVEPAQPIAANSKNAPAVPQTGDTEDDQEQRERLARKEERRLKREKKEQKRKTREAAEAASKA